MENLIAKLLDDFDHRRISRRDLIKSISLLTTAASVVAPASAADLSGIKAVAVNHISYQVNDYAKTRDFYADLLGMKVVGDTGTQCRLMIGDTKTFFTPKALQGSAAPRIDHVAFTIDNWQRDAVKAELDRRGLDPVPDTNSFHIKDPNGFDVELHSDVVTHH